MLLNTTPKTIRPLRPRINLKTSPEPTTSWSIKNKRMTMERTFPQKVSLKISTKRWKTLTSHKLNRKENKRLSLPKKRTRARLTRRLNKGNRNQIQNRPQQKRMRKRLNKRTKGGKSAREIQAVNTERRLTLLIIKLLRVHKREEEAPCDKDVLKRRQDDKSGQGGRESPRRNNLSDRNIWWWKGSQE